jgi:hypothetical protein
LLKDKKCRNVKSVVAELAQGDGEGGGGELVWFCGCAGRGRGQEGAKINGFIAGQRQAITHYDEAYINRRAPGSGAKL